MTKFFTDCKKCIFEDTCEAEHKYNRKKICLTCMWKKGEEPYCLRIMDDENE